jgi:hypothetical protein
VIRRIPGNPFSGGLEPQSTIQFEIRRAAIPSRGVLPTCLFDAGSIGSSTIFVDWPAVPFSWPNGNVPFPVQVHNGTITAARMPAFRDAFGDANGDRFVLSGDYIAGDKNLALLLTQVHSSMISMLTGLF